VLVLVLVLMLMVVLSRERRCQAQDLGPGQSLALTSSWLHLPLIL
jgi:hypothetical protein